jgi:hypothetical protein
LGISGLFPPAFVIHANYLFTLLIVSYNFSITTAACIASLYNLWCRRGRLDPVRRGHQDPPAQSNSTSSAWPCGLLVVD